MKKWTIAIVAFAGMFVGCAKPFEPITYEDIKPNEAAVLIPLDGDAKAQVSMDNEEFLKQKLVKVSRVRIPQLWKPKGYEWFFYNGEYIPAAVLIRVDMSPVTREWTADPNSGTSKKNEAIWVMTSDQVEWSTGWTCTAYISNVDDAIKFLSRYKNGTLSQVMDNEVRSKIQSSFGIGVTDLPMEELRKNSTPIIKKTVEEVTTFFKERGITVTNLGITGGFVYKNATIEEKMVEVFRAEQDKAIKIAGTMAQEEDNKRIKLEAESKAAAILTEKKAEAEGIQAVADAKAYEIEKAKQDLEAYLQLKRLELETKKMEKWDGRFPTYYMNSDGSTPDMLLQIPAFVPEKK